MGVALVLVLASPSLAQAACGVSASAALAFGVYDPFRSTPADTTGSVTVSCTGLAGVVSVDLSAGASGQLGARTLKQGNAVLAYGVYLDALRTVPMGDGTNGTGHFTGVLVALGAPVVFTFYGRLPARQVVAPGTYTDTLVVTVSY